jgi:2-dehydro-3-deoxyphosphogluconate aldolase / (4S)-4-hydroxy-2-oxoglutarate aldolase
MKNIFKTLFEYGIVPVSKIEDAEDAVPLAKALAKGGLPLFEVTFRSDAAAESIRRIATELPDLMIGAGTVTDVEKATLAKNAGARFVVTPGFNKKVVEYCLAEDMPVLPGCSNPTDIEMAMDYGFDTVKFFPAEAAGGIATIKAISAPYGNISFVPTGGINIDNMIEYLDFPKTLAIGGSWLTPPALVKERNFEGITAIAKNTVSKMLGFEVVHIGINSDNEDQANKTANTFASLFNFEHIPGSSSIFCGKGIEVVKQKWLGEMGHIAIKTNNIARAIAYFERLGVALNYESVKLKESKMIAIYLKEDIGGFAVHLLQK